MNKDNIVKNVCNDLSITQKELAELIGANEGTVRNWSSSNELPLWAKKSIEMLREIKEAKEVKETVQKLFILASDRTC